MDALSLHTATSGPNRSGASERLTWYDQRNNRVPSVRLGFLGPTVENSVAYTYDRQSHTTTHVHDHFTRRTYQVRSTSTYQ